MCVFVCGSLLGQDSRALLGYVLHFIATVVVPALAFSKYEDPEGLAVAEVPFECRALVGSTLTPRPQIASALFCERDMRRVVTDYVRIFTACKVLVSMEGRLFAPLQPAPLPEIARCLSMDDVALRKEQAKAKYLLAEEERQRAVQAKQNSRIQNVKGELTADERAKRAKEEMDALVEKQHAEFEVRVATTKLVLV